MRCRGVDIQKRWDWELRKYLQFFLSYCYLIFYIYEVEVSKQWQAIGTKSVVFLL